MKKLTLSLALLLSANIHALDLDKSVQQSLPKLNQLYLHLHQNPELSYQEEQTGKRLAKELELLGFDVTSNVGGFGVVGLYRNGNGPTVMIRADTDGLPIVEETGKPYASKVTVLDKYNNQVGVMHGCAHDIHMTSMIGTACLLYTSPSPRDRQKSRMPSSA